jgi:hypothetical protein
VRHPDEKQKAFSDSTGYPFADPDLSARNALQQ